MPANDEEEWRRIRGVEVSSHGRVRKGGRVLVGDIIRTGYRRVRFGAAGRGGYEMVHRLVCEAFHGSPPSSTHQAIHWDDDKLNNEPGNLRWGTAKENCADRYRNGRSRAKLDSRAVQLIRFDLKNARAGRSRAAPGTVNRLSRIFNVSANVIRSADRQYILEEN